MITEHLKVRLQARTRAEEGKQETESGSVKAAEETTDFTSPLENSENKVPESREDAGSRGKSEPLA